MNKAEVRQIKNLRKMDKLLENGFSIRDACDELGICVQTYYNIKNKYTYNKKFRYSDSEEDSPELVSHKRKPRSTVSMYSNSHRHHKKRITSIYDVVDKDDIDLAPSDARPKEHKRARKEKHDHHRSNHKNDMDKKIAKLKGDNIDNDAINNLAEEFFKNSKGDI